MGKNLYREMKNRHAAEMNAFSKANMFYAFSDDQFNAGLRKLGIAPGTPDAVCRVAGGGYVRAEKAEELADMLQRMDNEVDSSARSNPQFALDMFRAALNDTEYSYTGDSSEALGLLGYDISDILKDDVLQAAFKEATKTE